MNKSVLILSVFVMSVLLLANCASPSQTATNSEAQTSGAGKGDRFLLAKLDETIKSKILTDEGIRKYNYYIKELKEYPRIPEVTEYFTIALSFDAENDEAKRYASIMEDLRVYLHSENLKSAKRLLAKANLTSTEEYRLLKATQNAVYYDPLSEEASTLYKETQPRREVVVKAFLTHIEDAMKKARESQKPTDQESAYIDAFQLTTQSLAIAPSHSRIQSVKSELHSEISSIIKKRLEGIDSSVKSGKYRDAEKTIESTMDLNKKLGHEFDDDLNASNYSLYIAWAQYHFDRKEWSDSVEKARRAQTFKRSQAAADLIAKVGVQRDNSDKDSNFNTALKKLDDYIGQGDTGSAIGMIQTLRRMAVTQSQSGAIDNRQNKLAEQLPDFYAKALAAYKGENLSKAIELFELVVMIDSSYKDAQDYLDKAKDKKKLLDQY